MIQSSCKHDTKSKSHPSVKLAPVRVFSCKHPLMQAKVGLFSSVYASVGKCKLVYGYECLHMAM